MKKFASGMIAVLMAGILPLVQVQAQELTLESAIADLQYRMTVEWDQKDTQKQKEITNEFSAQVEKLKKQGVSDEQIFKGLSAAAFDKQTAKDLENLATYAKNKKLSSKETRKLVIDYANKSQKLGTNWSPDGATAIGIGIAIAILVVVILVSGSGGSTTYSGGYYDCYEDCYFDYYGYYYCETYCY